MRSRFEFTFHAASTSDAVRGDVVDPTLALLGAQGWEIRGIAARPDGGLTIALQRPYDEDVRLPDEPVLAAALAEPLVAPTAEELESETSG